MIIGPFNSFHIGRLKDILEANDAPYTVGSDPGAVEKTNEQQIERESRSKPQFKSYGDFLYMDLDEKYLPLIARELENMGLVVGKHTEQDSFDVNEYLCPQCDFVSHHPGICPTHNSTLLEFSEWVDSQRSGDAQFGRKLGAACLIITALIFIYYISTRAR